MSRNPATLQEVKVEVKRSRRHTTGPLEVKVDLGRRPKISAPAMSGEYAYINPGFVRNAHDVIQERPTVVIQPPNTVYREQYCVCSRWPAVQKVLAVAVGILLGAVIGLGVSMIFTRGESLDFLRNSVPD